MTKQVDVVIVGGRIGGALTALRLARNGVSVRLLEAKSFPSDTLSTHFFRGDGLVRSLAEVGVLDEVLATGAPRLECEYFSVDCGPFQQGEPQDPGELGFCLSVRRIALDAILVGRALDAGVDVRTHTRVVDVLTDEGVITGVVDHKGTVHAADVVVAADGRRSTVARLVGARDEERHAPARAMFYRYANGWQSPDPVGPEFLLNGANLCYVFPSDSGVACLALSLPVDDFASESRDPAAALEQSFRSNPRTADRMDDLTWVSRTFTGSPADSVWREACGPGWALVGDAGTAQDPWAGLGMDTAARQAAAFAEAFLAGDWTSRYSHMRSASTYDGFAETTELAPDLRQLVATGAG